MDSRMFDGLIIGVILIGVAIGLAIAAILAGIWWIISRVSVRWI